MKNELKVSDLENYTGNIKVVYMPPEERQSTKVGTTSHGFDVYYDKLITDEVEFVSYDSDPPRVTVRAKNGKERTIENPIEIWIA